MALTTGEIPRALVVLCQELNSFLMTPHLTSEPRDYNQQMQKKSQKVTAKKRKKVRPVRNKRQGNSTLVPDTVVTAQVQQCHNTGQSHALMTIFGP